MAPPFLPPGFMYLVVPAPGMYPHPWFAPGGGQLSHSISSSKATAVASAFWWAFLTLARLLSTEDSLLSLLGVQFLGGQTSIDWYQATVSSALLCFCPWQSSKEDTTSSINSGSPGGNPGSLCHLYTSRYKDCNSSLLV